MCLKIKYFKTPIMILVFWLGCSIQSHAMENDNRESNPRTRLQTAPDFNNLHKDIKFLICSMCESPAEFGTLAQVSIAWRDFINDNIKGCALIIGTPGSGKTSLANLMMGRQLKAKKGGKKLVTSEDFPDLPINHNWTWEGRSSRTLLILDRKNKEAIFDCRGFNFAGHDEYNCPGSKKSGHYRYEAESFKKMLRWKIRVILVETNDDFRAHITSFNVATHLFPNLNQLKPVLRLVIVGDNKSNYPNKKLPNARDFLDALYTNNKRRHYPEKIYEMIKYFIENPKLVAHFQKRHKKGAFKPRTDLMHLINDRTYVLSPVKILPPEEQPNPWSLFLKELQGRKGTSFGFSPIIMTAEEEEKDDSEITCQDDKWPFNSLFRNAFK